MDGSSSSWSPLLFKYEDDHQHCSELRSCEKVMVAILELKRRHHKAGDSCLLLIITGYWRFDTELSNCVKVEVAVIVRMVSVDVIEL